jgi:choline dehydrogenase-like flavoprotein
VHPIVQSMPLGIGDGLAVFRRVRAALGVANVWCAGIRRAESTISVDPAADGTRLVIDAHPASAGGDRIRGVIAAVRRALRQLDCLAPAGLAQVLPLGSSVHYAGTLPMSREDEAHTCAADGRVRGFTNLLVADGAGFPSLPPKNLTFTLMANAVRIAEAMPS